MPADPDSIPATGGALILAAGFARRFGSDKRRYRLPDGTPMLIATVRRYAEVFGRIAVILRPEDRALAEDVKSTVPTARIIFAADADKGMGHSLAAGIRELPHWTYACIGLGDMPFVSADSLRALRDAWQASGSATTIVQPAYRGQPGHPVIFPERDFDALASLQGDQGARALLARQRHRVLRLELDDPGLIQDIDRPPR